MLTAVMFVTWKFGGFSLPTSKDRGAEIEQPLSEEDESGRNVSSSWIPAAAKEKRGSRRQPSHTGCGMQGRGAGQEGTTEVIIFFSRVSDYT